MRSMHHIKRVAALVLCSMGAMGVHAANDNGNNGNASGQIKKEEKRAVSIPEPATWALLSAGIGALGLRALLRRRKRD